MKYKCTPEDENKAMSIGLRLVESLSSDTITRKRLLAAINSANDDLQFLGDFQPIIAYATGTILPLPKSASAADMYDPDPDLAMFIMVGFYLMSAIRRIVMSTSYDLNLPNRAGPTLYSLHMYGSDGQKMIPGLQALVGGEGEPDNPVGKPYPTHKPPNPYSSST